MFIHHPWRWININQQWLNGSCWLRLLPVHQRSLCFQPAWWWSWYRSTSNFRCASSLVPDEHHLEYGVSCHGSSLSDIDTHHGLCIHTNHWRDVPWRLSPWRHHGGDHHVVTTWFTRGTPSTGVFCTKLVLCVVKGISLGSLSWWFM